MSWRRQHASRTTYCTWSREPFFDLAGRHLPASRDAVVVDLAAGDGAFAGRLGLSERYDHCWLLDGNAKSVEGLRKQFRNVAEYAAPGRLPFSDGGVAFLHCSHLIEHLRPDALRALLVEIDRVLAPGGMLVVSTPLLHDAFFGDPSHVQPYPPVALRDLLCRERANRTVAPVSTRYEEVELVFRYAEADLAQGWGSPIAPVDLALHVAKRLLKSLGVRRYFKSGYTMVLRKGP